MANLLDGKKLAADHRRLLAQKISRLPQAPHLAVILVGDDEASHLYVNLKAKAAQEVGIKFSRYLYPANTAQREIISLIEKCNQTTDINGILVQLPLPNHLDENAIIKTINPNKDADGFHPLNIQNFLNDKPGNLTPGLITGIMKLIRLAGQNLTNKQAYILANSQEFAQPLSKALTDQAVNVTLDNQLNKTRAQTADIIITALGKPHFLTGDCFKDGAIIIDVGTSKQNGKTVGDIKDDDLVNRLVYLTPVPGGVGPMTVAELLWTVYLLYCRQHNIKF